MVKKRRPRPDPTPDDVEEFDVDIFSPDDFSGFVAATNPKKKRRHRDVSPDEDHEDMELAEEEEELAAEMAALEQAQAEKWMDENQPEKGMGGIEIKYNKEGLLGCVANLQREEGFLEHMTVCESVCEIADELDDLQREMQFYNHAISAVHRGCQQLQDLNVPFIRPDDYFCEHVKSDAHMGRIKDNLIVQEKRMAAFEQRKRREDERKYQKQLAKLQTNPEKKNPGNKKASRSSDAAWKEQLKKVDDTAEDKEEQLKKILKRSGQAAMGPKKSKKRAAMDRKYGLRGREKKLAKRNDMKSLNDLRDFSPRGGKLNRKPTMPGKKGKKKPNRPGKDQRTKARVARKQR